MDKLIVGAIAAAIIAVVVFFIVLFSTLMGALAGAIVGWVFDETFAAFLTYFKLSVEPWQVGAFLGFVGGFFKTSCSSSSN